MTLTNESIRCELHRLRVSSGQSIDSVARGCNDYLTNLYVFQFFPPLDEETLEAAENESIILIPNHVHAIAAFLGCTAHDIYPHLYPQEPSD